MSFLQIFGVKLDNISEDELKARLSDWCSRMPFGGTKIIVTPNPEMVLEARKNKAYQEILNHSALAIPDGVGLRFAAAAMCGVPNLVRHTGADVLLLCAESARNHNLPLVLFGGNDLSLNRTKQYFTTLIKEIKIITINPKIINNEGIVSLEILGQLQSVGPCVIAVALGQGKGREQGKQERAMLFLANNLPAIRVMIGVGGALDMYAALLPRAPGYFRRYGFEWLWRVVHEPWRWRRIGRAVIIFPIVVAYDTLRQGRFFHACWAVSKEIKSHFLNAEK